MICHSDHSLIFTADVRTFDLALEHTKKFSQIQCHVCKLFKFAGITHKPLGRLDVEKYNQLKFRGKVIIFCGIPSYICVRDNENVDKAAKALSPDIARRTFCVTGLGSID